MERSKFLISRFAYFLLALVWAFSIGTIIILHYATIRLPPISISGWLVYILIFWAAPLSIIATATWGIIQQRNTIIDDDKIEQPTITSGKAIVKWSEITSLKKEEYGRIIIYSNKTRIVISKYLFSAPQKLHEFIYNKVSSEKP